MHDMTSTSQDKTVSVCLCEQCRTLPPPMSMLPRIHMLLFAVEAWRVNFMKQPSVVYVNSTTADSLEDEMKAMLVLSGGKPSQDGAPMMISYIPVRLNESLRNDTAEIREFAMADSREHLERCAQVKE